MHHGRCGLAAWTPASTGRINETGQRGKGQGWPRAEHMICRTARPSPWMVTAPLLDLGDSACVAGDDTGPGHQWPAHGGRSPRALGGFLYGRGASVTVRPLCMARAARCATGRARLMRGPVMTFRE